jgi:gas vesicle protein
MSKGTGKFILGMGLGVGLGMLLSPNNGEENRKILKKKLDELIDYAQDIDPEDIKEKITKKAKEIEKEVKNLDSEKIAKIAKAKAIEIEGKCDELVDMAVESATPYLEDLAKEVKTRTVKTLKEITKKIEDYE